MMPSSGASQSPNLGGVPTLAQLEADQRVIIRELEQITSLVSRWSGRIFVDTAIDAQGFPLHNGYKDWSCDIVIHQARLASGGHYSTAVHEGLHSLSVGLNSVDFATWPGYEEGVVESLTRLLRDTVLLPLNIPRPLASRQGVYYQNYVDALEVLRLKTKQAEHDFYLDLLRTPLRGRENLIVQWIVGNNPHKTRTQVVRETALIAGRLKI